MPVIRLGTRGSQLALVQSGWVARKLEEQAPETKVELVEIRTTGDRIVDVALGPGLGQSFFTKEIEEALLGDRIDLAVHSCKDLATEMRPGLTLGAVPPREDPRDVLVSRGPRLSELERGARIGTSSPRRKGFLQRARPDLVVQDQRGNVPTRLRAIEDGKVDAVVLAAAGLRRLGLLDAATEVMDPVLMTPAASQGALALQIRTEDAHTAEIVAVLDDTDTRAQVTAERACLRVLEGGCQAPVGILAETAEHRLLLRAAVVAPGGIVRAEVNGRATDAEDLGAKAAHSLLRQLGVSSLREAAWAGPPPVRLSTPGDA